MSFISFSLSSLRSCITVSASLSKHSDNLDAQKRRFLRRDLESCRFFSQYFLTTDQTNNLIIKMYNPFNHTQIWICAYSMVECVFLSMWLAAVPLWGSFGEDGSDESVISSMSE